MYKLIKESTGLNISNPKINLTKEEIKEFVSSYYHIKVSLNTIDGLRESSIEIKNSEIDGVNLKTDVREFIKLNNKLISFSESKDMRMTPLALKILQKINLEEQNIKNINPNIVSYDFYKSPAAIEDVFSEEDLSHIFTQFMALDTLAEIYLKLKNIFLKEFELFSNNISYKYEIEDYLENIFFSIHKNSKDFIKLIKNINQNVYFFHEDELNPIILSEILMAGFNRIIEHTEIHKEEIPPIIRAAIESCSDYEFSVDNYYKGYLLDPKGVYKQIDLYIIKRLMEITDVGQEIERDLQTNDFGLVGHLNLKEKYK